MITKSITYTDHNGEEQTEVFHFHISKAVLADHLIMIDKLEEFRDLISGPPRTLKPEETQKIVEIVKFFLSISYGVKSADGRTFDQDDPAGSGSVWKSFRTHAAYDSLLMSIFENPDEGIMFILSVLPQDLRTQAEAELDPEVAAALKAAQVAARPPRGSRIDEDGIVTTPTEQRALQSVPTAPASTDDEDPDFEAMLAEADEDPNAGKDAITQAQANFMEQKLRAKPGQFERFMSTRYIKDPVG